jgi:hypothetical protein
LCHPLIKQKKAADVTPRPKENIGMRTNTKARERAQATKRSINIDHPDTLAVYDGQKICGYVRSVDGHHHLAYGPDRALIGSFGKFLDAMRALPGGRAP